MKPEAGILGRLFPATNVKDLRQDLKLTVPQLATLLGVAPSTINRWESSTSASIDPSTARILLVLQSETTKRTSTTAKSELAEAIATALAIGGGLFALFIVLEHAFRKDKR